ncbi:alpha/beta hydrolase [Sphingomonas sp. ASY06-1R]|uniref:alpha/beta hydrolase n=1 Tax=Sphingomonas sp. ASY06-1R TaxID=3445771 RepID=UPI003FA1E106
MTFEPNHRRRFRHGVGLAIASALLSIALPAQAQEVQRLYQGKAPGSERWSLPEAVAPTPDGGKVFANVVDPEYIAYLPDPAKAEGSAAILLPGGGLRALYVGAEAKALIARLNAEGVVVFVLKYRVAQLPPRPPVASTGAPPTAPVFPKLVIRNANANPSPDDKAIGTVFDFAVRDAQTALTMIRARASQYRIDPHRIGMIGASAGGGVAIGALLRAGAQEPPVFLASLYGPSLIDVAVPAEAPPLFIATETSHGPVTDGLLALFTLWKEANRPAELHIFDVPTFKMPATLWLDRFVDWMREQKLLRARRVGQALPAG